MLLHKLNQKICRRLCQRDRSIHSKVVALQPDSKLRGNVLLSFIIDPFLRKSGELISHDHTHDWESSQMAQTFLDRGYAVDVISYHNNHFRPQKKYDFFVSARTNLEHIAARLNSDCIKIAHLDTAHWLFNNQAAYTRLLELQQRRGAALTNAKMIVQNMAIEQADLATILGNQFTIDTYGYADKEIYRIPISAPVLYPWNDEKKIEQCRNNYLWFGSSGFVHKGLDLVLEAFAAMPEYRLTVCGPLEEEKAFARVYHQELFETPNIETVGWIDVNGSRFREIARNTLGLVYPTCSEGGGGSAITCMHAGIIPILSLQASVDTGSSGIILENCTIPIIQKAVQELSSQPPARLEKQVRLAWETARNNHTRELFAAEYNKFVSQILLGETSG